MARYKVLSFLDATVGAEIHDSLKGVAEVINPEPTRESMLKYIGQVDGYIAGLSVRLDKEALDHTKTLKIVATPSTGLDHLDLDELKKRNIRLISIKTEFGLLDKVTATAELAWLLMLACHRKLPWAHGAAMRGEWARDKFRGHQVAYKTLGILGVGRLGKMVATYGQAFRFRVIGCDNNPREKVSNVEYVDFDTLLRESDVISIHVHLTPENRHLIGAKEFAKMKDGVVIINTSRGGIVDEAAFVAALKSGKVGAAGLDVIEGEWRTDLIEHPLIKYAREHENLVISPHVGGITYESQFASSSFISQKMADALRQLTPGA